VTDWLHEMKQAASLDRFARDNPGHERLADLRARRRRADESYLRWVRRCCGFALWLFRIA